MPVERELTSLPAPTDIVLGPPGCGKTTDLLGQVDELLQQGVPPEQIGYYSFTRRAATEAQDRAMAKFGLSRADLPHFRTLHSECMRCMGISSQQVLDGAKMQDFSDWIGEEITGRFSIEEGLKTGHARGDRMLFMDGLARVHRISLREQYDLDHDDLDWSAVERFSRGLREFKDTNALVDYTDMLEMFVQSGPDLRLHTVFVDESQDLSALQWAVVARLCRESHRVVVAGDDDQAIYRWSGADVEYLLRLDGSVRVLGQSWRVPRSVQRVADGIIARVRDRRPKTWQPRPDEGSVSWASNLEEVDWWNGDIMVLARNQYLLRDVMGELEAGGYLYEHRGRPSVKQGILDAVVTWERLRRGNPAHVADVRKMYEMFESGRGVARGHKSLPGCEDDQLVGMGDLRQSHGLLAPDAIWHEVMTRIPARERSYMVRCRKRGERFSASPRIRVGTIHDSKGGERDHVVLLTDMAQRTHSEMWGDPDSEARVFYVGATRARERLTVMRPKTARFYEV